MSDGAFIGAALSIVAATAAVIAAVAAAGLGATARNYLRLAAGLSGALATADCLAAVDGGARAAEAAAAVTLLVAALAPALMAMAAFSEERGNRGVAAAALALAAAACAGIAAAVAASPVLAFVPLAIAATILGAMAPRLWREAGRCGAILGAGAASLFAAGAAAMGGGSQGRIGFALFLSAGLLGVVTALARRSDAAVEQHRGGAGRAVFISGKE